MPHAMAMDSVPTVAAFCYVYRPNIPLASLNSSPYYALTFELSDDQRFIELVPPRKESQTIPLKRLDSSCLVSKLQQKIHINNWNSSLLTTIGALLALQSTVHSAGGLLLLTWVGAFVLAWTALAACSGAPALAGQWIALNHSDGEPRSSQDNL